MSLFFVFIQNSQAQDLLNDRLTDTTFSLDLDNREDLLDYLFFFGGTRDNPDGNQFLSETKERYNRLRVEFGCENLRGSYKLGGESRVCVYKNNTGSYTITGFTADKTTHAANKGSAFRGSSERIGLRGEHFFHNMVIGGEAGLIQEKVKFAAENFNNETDVYLGLTISRPLEPRQATNRNGQNRVDHNNLVKARELQTKYALEFAE